MYFCTHLYDICAMRTSMTVSKTRAKLVDVARQLFAKNGVAATTMLDIALASKKGRRTLYTYFKSKEEIYTAVVEAEIEMLTEQLKKVAKKDIDPEKKIMELIYTHLETTKDIVYRNGTLKAGFFRDIWRVEAERKELDVVELEIIRRVMQEGIDKGRFDIEDATLTARVMMGCLKGIEVPFIRGQIAMGIDAEVAWKGIEKLVYRALGVNLLNE